MPSAPIFAASQTLKIMPIKRKKIEDTVRIAAFLINKVFFIISPRYIYVIFG